MTKRKPRKRLTKQDDLYINNSDFTSAVSVWKENLIKNGSETIPHFVADCFLKIVTRYSNKLNFSGYTYIEDMRGDALLACVKYAHNFNPLKSQNAFAYFTTIVHNSFLQYLKKEKHFTNFRFKLTGELLNNSSKYDYNTITHREADAG